MSTNSYASICGVRKKGLVLPITIILLAFATVAIIVAGTVSTRTTSRLADFRIISDLQLVADNVLELAASSVDVLEDEFNDNWQGLEDFIDFVRIREGLLGHYWAETLGEMAEDEEGNGNWLVLSNDSGFMEAISELDGIDGYSIDAAVYRVNSFRHFVVSKAEKNGIKRYSFGMATRYFISDKSALTFGDTERVFNQLLNYDHDKKSVIGDFIGGKAVIFDETELHILADLWEVFFGGLSTDKVLPEDWQEQVQAPPSSKYEYFSNLYNDHVESLSDLDLYDNRVFDLPDDFGESITPSGDELIRINYKGDDDFLIVQFDADGYVIFFEDSANTNKDEEVFKVFQTEDGSIANIHVDGADLVISSTEKIKDNPDPNNAHKILYITGQYSITTYGDIDIWSSLCYSDLKDGFPSNVFGKPLSVVEIHDSKSEVWKTEVSDYLSLTSLGGSVDLKHNSASEGNKLLTADISAIPTPSDGYLVGGSIFSSNLQDVVKNNKNSQLYLVGSFTANSFLLTEYLDQLVAITERRANGDSGGMVSVTLRLVTKRTW